MKRFSAASVLAIALLTFAVGIQAQTKNHASAKSVGAATYEIDASTSTPTPETGYLQLGATRATGESIGINSRYLTRDGRPWLPVMGEFQFSRTPEAEWADELAKMKAAGVNVVASYVFWLHHEEVEGQFDWTGQRDLRRFVELCAQNGLYVYLRIGPWDHGEARNGGFPDWLMAKHLKLRTNDAEYLRYVGRLYGEIGKQIAGLQWQQGGPIIGVQLENEYGMSGPGAGAEHIAALRRLALEAGIHPPLMSVFGGVNLAFPQQVMIPFTGGYPDKFWYNNKSDLPPSTLYLFSTQRPTAKDMGALGATETTGKVDYGHYPLLMAEGAGGMENSYQRRVLMPADDIASLATVRVGSGVNMVGYYLFHGGANPQGKLTTLEESRATGYPNDIPTINYDFQAPLGEYGAERASYRKLKTLHLFLNAYGEELAPMMVHLPSELPKGADDSQTVRVALRSDGHAGFLFVNNYERKLAMTEHKGFQVRLKLAQGEMTVPRRAVTVPANSYFVWPVNLSVGGATLKYATAQPLTRLKSAAGDTYFFIATPGIAPEFVFAGGSVRSVQATTGTVTKAGADVAVEQVRAGRDAVITVTAKDGRTTRMVVLTEAQAEDFWLMPVAGADTALLSAADVFAAGDGLHLRATDVKKLRASFFEPNGTALWREQVWAVAPRQLPYTVSKEHDAPERGAVKVDAAKVNGLPMPLEPTDEEFARGAAAWRIEVPQQEMAGLSNVYLRIHYAGDMARLSAQGRLLDDDFYNGSTWEIGLKRFMPEAKATELELKVLPMPQCEDLIYLDPAVWAQMNAKGETLRLDGVEVAPEYEVVLRGR